ncbi:MAG: hypothetical protein ACYS29_07670 [Planctomycetota bacterium]
MIKFDCSHCQRELSIPESYAGKRVRCANCRQVVSVPAAQPTPGPAQAGIVRFRCPGCRQKIGVTADYAGKRVKCAACGQTLRVPALEQQPPPELPPEDTLRVAQPPPPPAARSVTCPFCQSPNAADNEICTACGQIMVAQADGPASAEGDSMLKPVAASVGLTLAAAAAWVLLASQVEWFVILLLHAFAVGVAALAGYGMTMFTDKRTKVMGLLAIVIGLAGIVVAKVAIAKLIILPRADTFVQAQSSTEVSDEQLDKIIRSPDATFMYACFHLAEQFEWDWEFTMEVTTFYTFERAAKKNPAFFKGPPFTNRSTAQTKKLKDAVKQVEEAIAGWSEQEKRQAIRSGFAKHKEWFKEGFRTAFEEMADGNQPGQPPPEFVKETFDVVTGDRPHSDSPIGRFLAVGGSCCCLDIIWIPLGLFFAYKNATGWR